jgi:hypothetical protein
MLRFGEEVNQRLRSQIVQRITDFSGRHYLLT